MKTQNQSSERQNRMQQNEEERVLDKREFDWPLSLVPEKEIPCPWSTIHS